MSDGSRECLIGETSSLNPSGRCLPIRLTRSAMWVFIAGYQVTSCYDDRFSAYHMAECLLETRVKKLLGLRVWEIHLAKGEMKQATSVWAYFAQSAPLCMPLHAYTRTFLLRNGLLVNVSFQGFPKYVPADLFWRLRGIFATETIMKRDRIEVQIVCLANSRFRSLKFETKADSCSATQEIPNIKIARRFPVFAKLKLIECIEASSRNPRTGLDAVEIRKEMSCPCRQLNPGPSSP
jgi:hypothetical protein